LKRGGNHRILRGSSSLTRQLQGGNNKNNKDNKNKNNKDNKIPDQEETKSPTLSPTTKTPTLLPFLAWSEVFPLQICQGDCDNDDDCAEGLVCKQRDISDPVPGCTPTASETLATNIDFCILAPETESPTESMAPTRAPTTAAPTISPEPTKSANPTSFPTITKSTWPPGVEACEKSKAGQVFTTPFGVKIEYYYEVLTTEERSLAEVTLAVDGLFQKFLSQTLVDCSSGNSPGDIQGVSPADLDNLAGECTSTYMINEESTEDLVCFQMLGNVEVYMDGASALTQGEIREMVWSSLETEINQEATRKLVASSRLIQPDMGIYGLRFLGSGTDNTLDGATGASGVKLSSDEPAVDAATAVGIACAFLVVGVFLFVMARKRSGDNEEEKRENEISVNQVPTRSYESDDDDESRMDVPPPPPSPMQGGYPVSTVQSELTHGSYDASTLYSTNVMKRNQSEQSGVSYGDWSVSAMSEGTRLKGTTSAVAEDQFRVSGYSAQSNISTMAEQFEKPAQIKPILGYDHIVRGKPSTPLAAHVGSSPSKLPLLRTFDPQLAPSMDEAESVSRLTSHHSNVNHGNTWYPENHGMSVQEDFAAAPDEELVTQMQQEFASPRSARKLTTPKSYSNAKMTPRSYSDTTTPKSFVSPEETRRMEFAARRSVFDKASPANSSRKGTPRNSSTFMTDL
jgi:hypothetical protein